MSNLSAGQIVGGVIGAVVGFVSGGPAGAFKGAALGMSIGGYINPPNGPTIRGPTLDDISYQSTAYGVPLRRVYGQIAMAGNIIYLENNKYKAVQKSQETGGKGGGGQKVITTTYFATFAVALCEAYPGSQIKRIWAGGKLIVAPNSAPSNKFTYRYYDGTQTTQDPRMVSVLGAERTPTYEGTAYIIFYDFELTEYGNGLAGCPIKVELIGVGSGSTDTSDTLDQYAVTRIKGYSAPPAPNEKPSTSVPISAGYVNGFFANQYNTKKYWFQYGDAGSFQNAPHTLFASLHVHGESSGLAGNNIVWAFDALAAGPPAQAGILTNLGFFVSPFYSPATLNVLAVISASGVNYGIYRVISSPVLGLSANTVFVAVLGASTYSAVLETLAGSVSIGGYAIANNRIHYFRYAGFVGSDRLIIKRLSDGGLVSDTPFSIPFSPYYALSSNTFSEIYNNKIYAYNLWPTNDTIILLSIDLTSFDLDWSGFNVDMSDAAIILDDTAINIGIYYGKIAVSYNIAPFLGFRYIAFVVFEKVTSDGVIARIPISSIVENELQSVGLTPAEYDLSQIASITTIGYAVTQVSSVRAALGPIVSAYLFDLVEIGYKIVARVRGGTATTFIPYSDLIFDESAVVQSQTESKVLVASRMTINYIEPAREYETGTQYADYPTPYVNPVINDLAVVMTADEAIKLADIFIKTSRFELRKYRFTLPQKYLYLNVSYVISVEVYPGKYIQFRIDERNQTLSNTLQIVASPTSPATYQSDASGIPGEAPSTPTIPEYAAPIPFVLDIPMIVNEQDLYGVTATIAQTPPTTQVALVVSPNGGVSYTEIGRIDGPGNIGQVLSDELPVGDPYVTERGTTLLIDNLISGDFFSVTYDQMLRNNNMVAYGQPGRWEIMLFEDATPGPNNQVTLSTFIRGMYGTEQYMGTHESGDFVIQLDHPNTIFAPLPAQAFGQSWPIKAINVGDDVDGGIEANYGSYLAVNLTPLSVVNPDVWRGGLDWIIDFDPRTRYESTQWVTGSPEQTDTIRYDVDILNGGIVVRTIESTTIPITYTEAQQIADFGASQTTITIDIYQVNQRVGRGYPLRVTA